MQNRMLQVEREEKATCILKLKEVIDEKEGTITSMQKEVERLAQRLCVAESRLFELDS